MRVEAEATTVGQYFNTNWQAGLTLCFGISVNTTVRVLWVVDNPASSYQFQEIAADAININWNWYSPDNSNLSKVRLDYHQHADILYIINQEQRQHSRTVYDVLKPRTAD